MGNDDQIAVQFLDKPYKVVKADSGGVRFVVPIRRRYTYCLHLLAKDCPHEKVYTISLNEIGRLFDVQHNNVGIKFRIHDFYNEDTSDFWVTWFNNQICLGKWNGPTLLRYPEVNKNHEKMIGFVHFKTYSEHNNSVEWDVETSPFIYPSIVQPKHVDGGDLRWVKMTSGSILPDDALIGGFENEPLYIARAPHNGSLTPGKYLKSKQLAIIPWSRQAFPKEEFEILCGYDAIWAAAKSTKIPENAFIGGYSEARQEPLFIGRAWVDNDLIVGKVHLFYQTCYIPYRNSELEENKYEILVTGNRPCRGERSELPCYMKMDMTPCL